MAAMADISEGKIRNLIGKSWSYWNLPECSTDNDLAKLREVYKPKEPDKPADHCNLLPSSLMHLYGSRPDIEFFSVTKCAGCNYFIKTQWLSHHFKRDAQNNMVCRKTELIVSGSKSLGKATTCLHEIRESTRTPFIEISTSQLSQAKIALPKSSTSLPSESSVSSSRSPTRSKSSSTHKTETVASSSSKSKHSHHQSKTKSSSSNSATNSTNSSKSKSSKSSTGTSSSSSSWPASKIGSSKSSHKSNSSAGTYTLSIPSDNIGQNESVESILFSNATTGSKNTMHIIATSTSKSKGDTEYETLKFYADSAEKKSKPSVIETDSNGPGHKSLSSTLHTNSDSSHFKIPSKSSKSSGSSNTSSGSHVDSHKKSKSSHGQFKSTQDSSSNKIVFRSSSSSSSSPKSSQVSSHSSSSELKSKGETSSSSHGSTEAKEKSSGHSKKKKKKKEKDGPRKVIPLKDRAFHPDHHCGVCLPEESNPCTRSLTCKTHSIALRRAVIGRSNPFDSLLAAHKKARDEEKNAKAREHGDDSKSKDKKSGNHSGTSSAATDAISISSAHTIVFEKGPVAPVNETKGNAKFLAPGAVPLSISAQSLCGRSVSSPSNVGSKTSNTQQQMLRNVSKSISNPKSAIKPLIVLEERKEVPGLSLFDIAREPENKFVYVTSVKAPRIVPVLKTDGKRGTTALSELNPLDCWHQKEQPPRKKLFKPSHTHATESHRQNQVPIASHRMVDKAISEEAIKDISYEPGEISNSLIKRPILKSFLDDPSVKTSTVETLDGPIHHRNSKRKTVCSDEYSVCPLAQKYTRLVSNPKDFYDTLMFKPKESSNQTFEALASNWEKSLEPVQGADPSGNERSQKSLDYEEPKSIIHLWSNYWINERL